MAYRRPGFEWIAGLAGLLLIFSLAYSLAASAISGAEPQPISDIETAVIVPELGTNILVARFVPCENLHLPSALSNEVVSIVNTSLRRSAPEYFDIRRVAGEDHNYPDNAVLIEVRFNTSQQLPNEGHLPPLIAKAARQLASKDVCT